MYFDQSLDKILTETIDKKKYKAAVAIIFDRDKWLLGLAKTNDDRDKKWVFVGGGIKNGETPQQAAVREAREESGLKCKAVSDVIRDYDRDDVAFIACKYTESRHDIPEPNHEFYAMGWFKESEMKSLKLYNNVRRLIQKAKKYQRDR